ncbi:hypothetical protein PoB_002370900 [Plakobranchus ocellatus]|uniref:Uncharacterized protein n=1 Tax=Plakobranchus ocellatus TaxID=259542 RepID=A0AAV3ZS20_9GAST|nr:hypothetical protein PoB_002370900 [Plakobranchus ocellatus]
MQTNHGLINAIIPVRQLAERDRSASLSSMVRHKTGRKYVAGVPPSRHAVGGRPGYGAYLQLEEAEEEEEEEEKEEEEEEEKKEKKEENEEKEEA